MSSDEPDPTAANPIPIEFNFEDGVDEIKPLDFSVINGDIQNIFREEPDFRYEGTDRGLENFQVKTTTGELLGAVFSNNIEGYLLGKLSRTVISIDFNENSELFYLTLGDGVFKIDGNGDVSRVISGNEFETPLDMVLNRVNGNIYVADAEKGQVLIFDSSYNSIGTIGTGSNANSDNPRGATGLALDDEGNIYVADNFTGITANQDAIKIYAPNGSLIKKITTYSGQQIEDPFRIAVDKNKNIYVSESGGEARAPRIIIFDENYNPKKVIQGGEQGNPGSLVVDHYGYLYVVDYEDDFNLTNLFNDPLKVLGNYETIRDAKYTVNVFDTNQDFSFVKEFSNTNLNLPIDLALDNCGVIYINNLRFQGDPPESIFGYPALMDINFDFTLKKFQREDNFTAEVIPDDPGLVEVFLEGADLFKCGLQPEGEFSIIYQPEEENTAPEANNDDFYETNQDETLIVSAPGVLENDTDAEGDALTAEIVDQPVNGTVIFNSDGSFTYEPDPGFSGTDTFTYVANDGNLDSNEATVTITVNAPPQVNCNGQTVPLDENGQAQITAEDVYGSDPDLDNVLLNLSQASFDCSDAGNDVEVTLRVTDKQTGLYTECSATIKVTDNEDPEIECIEDKEFTVEFGETGTAVEYVAPTATDNCGMGSFGLTAGFAPGDVFPVGKTTVTYTATDVNGNTATCSFIVNVIENADPEPPVFTNCPNYDITISTATGQCDVAAPFPMPEATDNSGNVSVELTSDLGFEDRFPTGEHRVSYLATDEAGNTAECSFSVTVTEDVAPQITCPDPKTANFNAEEGFEVPDYRDEIAVSDNCTSEENLPITQSPAAGEVIYASQPVTFSVIDASGNTNGCSFQLTLEEREEEELEIICPADQDFNPDENCQYVLQDFTGLATVNLAGAIISQSPEPGTVISGDSETITLTASLGEETVSCTFTLNRRDTGVPYVICPGNQTVDSNSEEGFTIPNYISQSEVSDNCAIASVEQLPEPGVLIQQDTEITITATDAAGNSYTCRFWVFIEEEGEGLDINCPGTQTENFNENCEFELPDYTGSLQQQFPQATFTQSPAAGTVISAGTTITISGTRNGENDSCSFQLNLSDTSKPRITCPGPKTANFNAEEGFTVPDYRDEVAVSDNCTSEENLQITQSPAAGEVIYASQQISFTVTDVSGNNASCGFQLTLQQNQSGGENNNPLANDDYYEIFHNQTLMVSAPGILANDTDADGDNLTASLQNGPSFGTVSLNADGSFIYVPQEDYTGPDSFTYIASDGEGNSGPAVVNIEVKYDPPVARNDNYSTQQDTQLQISAEEGLLQNDTDPDADLLTVVQVSQVNNGSLNLRPDGSFMYTPNTGFSGVDSFTYYVTDGGGESAEATVTINVIGDNTNAFIDCREVVTLNLDENGTASLTLPDLYVSKSDNVEVTADNLMFDCSNLENENFIELTYSGALSGSCSVEVVLQDNIAPVADCVDAFSLSLVNGTANLSAEEIDATSSDNCGIANMNIDKTTFTTADIGENIVTLTVIDAAGNTDSCQTVVTVTADNTGGGEVNCVNGVTLELDQNGEAILDINDVYTGNPQGELSLSRSLYTCADMGVSRQRFYYTENGQETFCEFSVTVADNLGPQIVPNPVPLQLDENGQAVLTEELLRSTIVARDNCSEELTFEFGPDEFTCKDVGQNYIDIEVTDENGNSTTARVAVYVEAAPGLCQPQDWEFIRVYPNPNTGQFKVLAPSNVIIDKILVFDMRGRFLLERQFEEELPGQEYTMDIGSLETAVYVLQIFTTKDGREEKIIRRIIYE
ncbi:tandem-95 repeat protein [Zunongwangia sp. F363]|uniref:Tandem-95 repeat protein n=1 Tax=Autumnicola tepida TaxID=3075595 RepID=A0ABU3CEU4_9FLAO|nr:tandem-95 repeat protein [Zunongwangia sp. F363]MDT0644872.1 tandem-95 repeat protein [Zunongwangia sp. F363]